MSAVGRFFGWLAGLVRSLSSLCTGCSLRSGSGSFHAFLAGLGGCVDRCALGGNQLLGSLSGLCVALLGSCGCLLSGCLLSSMPWLRSAVSVLVGLLGAWSEPCLRVASLVSSVVGALSHWSGLAACVGSFVAALPGSQLLASVIGWCCSLCESLRSFFGSLAALLGALGVIAAFLAALPGHAVQVFVQCAGWLAWLAGCVAGLLSSLLAACVGSAVRVLRGLLGGVAGLLRASRSSGYSLCGSLGSLVGWARGCHGCTVSAGVTRCLAGWLASGSTDTGPPAAGKTRRPGDQKFPRLMPT